MLDRYDFELIYIKNEIITSGINGILSELRPIGSNMLIAVIINIKQ